MNIKISEMTADSTVNAIMDALKGSVVRLDDDVEVWVAGISEEDDLDAPTGSVVYLNGYMVGGSMEGDDNTGIPLFGIETMEVLG